MKYLLILAVLVVLPVFDADAAEPPLGTLRLGYGVVEGFIEDNDSGIGFELMEEVVHRLRARGYGVEVGRAPFPRQIKAFQAGRLDLVFPIVSDGGYARNGYRKWGFERIPLYSAPLYNGGRFVIHTGADRPKLDTVESLRGRSVAVIAGAFIPSELRPPSEYDVVEVPDGAQGFRMLRRKRVDAFLLQENWSRSILEDVPAEGIHHGARFGLVVGGFITQQTERGAGLLAEVNQEIGAMILDGTHAAILARYPDNRLAIRPPR